MTDELGLTDRHYNNDPVSAGLCNEKDPVYPSPSVQAPCEPRSSPAGSKMWVRSQVLSPQWQWSPTELPDVGWPFPRARTPQRSSWLRACDLLQMHLCV